MIATPATTTLAEAALQYAAAGYAVFPLEPGGKRPLSALVPHGKDNATRDPGLIRSWWSAAPDANIGLATAPSGIIVVDVDVAAGKPGIQSLGQLQLEFGELPPTLTARTGRGGQHRVFRRPPSMAPHTRLGIREAVDVIGNGYIVVWPSSLPHGQYTWTNELPIAELPERWLAALERPAASTGTSGIVGTGIPSSIDPAEFNRAALELAAAWPSSGRHTAQLALAGALAAAGWEAEQIAGFAAAVARLEPGREAGYDGEPAKRLTAARSSIAKLRAGEPAVQWNALAGHLGAEGWSVLERVKRRIGIEANREREAQCFIASLRAAAMPPAAPLMLHDAVPPGAALRYRACDLGDRLAAASRLPWIPIQIGSDPSDEIGSLSVGSMAVLTAASGAGKTTLALAALLQHARARGPAVLVSCEMSHEQAVSRLVGMELDISWRQAQERGADPAVMAAVAALPPRLVILARDGDDDHARLSVAQQAVAQLRANYPGEPIVVAIDYLQILPSELGDERDERSRTAVNARLCSAFASRLQTLVILISQSSRTAATALRKGDLIGADTASTGAESAQIERETALSIAIGTQSPVDDRESEVQISIGKGRYGGGDMVIPCRLAGASGRWRVVGRPVRAADYRESRREQAASRSAAVKEQAHAERMVALETRILREVAARPRISPSALRSRLGCSGQDRTWRDAISHLIDVGHILDEGIDEAGRAAKAGHAHYALTPSGVATLAMAPVASARRSARATSALGPPVPGRDGSMRPVDHRPVVDAHGIDR